MFLSKDRQSFTKRVSIIVALQGLAWCALGITGIVVYSSPPDKLKQDIRSYERYIDYLSRVIYDEFMEGVRDRIIRPTDFLAFLWIYTILSAVWVAVSIDQYTAIQNKKYRQSVISLVLGVTVLATSIIDLVFVSLLARDLDTCPFSLVNPVEDITTSLSTVSSAATESSTTEPTITESLTTESLTTESSTTTITTTITTGPLAVMSLSLLQSSFISLRNTGSTSNGTAIDCQLANGVIMTLAARGFILWAVNVVLAISLITIGVKALRTPTLLTYHNNTIPRVRAPEVRKQSSQNELIFLGDNDVFTPSPVPQQKSSRNRNSTPASLGNKNEILYY